jgi:hypothetical protein
MATPQPYPLHGEPLSKWYQRNRWRIDGLTVVIPLKDDKQTTLQQAKP